MPVVISEIYAGSGSSSSLYQENYVELFNNSDQPAFMEGYSVQYSDASSSSWQSVNLTGFMQPYGYYLIVMSTGQGQFSLGPQRDATASTNIDLDILAGKVALVRDQMLLTSADPRPSPFIEDFVGYGNNPGASEGSPAPAGSETLSITRQNGGLSDSDDNERDFQADFPDPQSFSSPPNVCYVTGTLMRMACGDVAVEHLQVGDRVVTASGAERPIRWIGRRIVAPRSRTDAMPVRIAADAFGEGRPARDLYVSPAHAIAVDVLGEVLIPACRLVNGTTITQVEVETVTYWHVELDSHDILLAENLPAESYLDCGNRGFFANAAATDLMAAPDARPEGPLPFCRPFHEAGPLVDLVRGRLRERAEALGWHRVEETFGGLHLVADGETIRPDVEGLTARFVLPAAARDVRLVSTPSVPAHVVPGSTDRRRLGLPLARLTLDDGLTGIRTVALDDPRLGAGFHAVEGGRRWTDGAATLPADLWAGCRGTVFLRMTLGGPALPRWVAPQDEAQGEAAGTRDPAERYRA